MQFGPGKKRSRGLHEHECQVEEEAHEAIQFDAILEDFMARTRRLLVVGTIDELTAASVCSSLQLFSLRKDPVYMYINSPGGCLASGYAIVDQMLACRCPIYTVVRGQAYSMGAIIAAFGSKGCRFATPNSSLMLHPVIVQSGPDAIDKHNEMTDHINMDYDRKVADLAKRLNVGKKQLKTIMQETRWMIPKQAIDIGLIDGLWTPKLERSVSQSLQV